MFRFLLLLSVVCASFGPGNVARAEEPVFPTAEEVLASARVDRFQFSDTIETLRGLIPFMKTKEQYFTYLGILDELKAIEAVLKFPVFDVSPLDGYSVALVRATLRRSAEAGDPVDLVEDPEAVLKAILRFGEDDDREVFLRQQYDALRKIGEEAPLRAFHARLTALAAYLASLEPAVNLFLIEKFDDLQGRVVARILDTFSRDISDEDFAATIAVMRAPAGMVSVVERLQTEFLRTTDEEHLRKLSRFTVVVKKRLDRYTTSIDIGLAGKPSAILAGIIAKIVEIGGSMSVGETADAVAALEPTQMQGLSRELVLTDFEWIFPSQVNFLIQLAEYCKDRLHLFGFVEEELKMGRFIDNVTLFGRLNEVGPDGVYYVRIDGKTYRMTVARSGPIDMAVTLTMGSVNLTMGFAAYDAVTDRFEISSVSPLQGVPTNTLFHVARLRFSANGETVSGSIDTGTTRRMLEGRRVKTFRDFVLRELEAPREFVGLYRGRVGGGSVREGELRVYRHGIGYTGVLILKTAGGNFRVEFSQSYTSNRNNVIYLTLREGDENFRMVQVRGVIEADGFFGDYIRGGSDEAWPMSLTRVDPNDG